MSDRMAARKNRGFTLIELLIVMAILALLVALAWPQFAGILTGSKQKLNDTNVQLIEQALELYSSNENDQSAALAGTLDENHPLVQKGYLKEAPHNPENNGLYQIYEDSKGNFRVKINTPAPTT